MSIKRRIQRSLSLGIVAVAGVAPIAAAQWGRQAPREGRELFEWRGSVDREVQIVMRDNRVWTNNIGRTEPNNERSRTLTSLPRQDGEVVVQVENGRGDVSVIQQPSARNGYTTIVRIQDPRSGQDGYRVTAYWRGYAGGDIYNRGNDDDRGRGRGRDGVWGSRDRDDNNDRNDRNDRNGGWDRQNSVLHWSGNVDGELEIRVQDGRVEYRTISGNQPTGIRVNAGNVSTRGTSGSFRISDAQGRGSVNVVQQPSMWNGYTTVIRVRDPQGGYGYYDFDLIRQ